MMRRHAFVVFLVVMLSSAVHVFAQSTYDPPPAPPLKTPIPIPAALGGVQRPQALGFGDNGESGTYTYDGSGNITAIGSDTFLYDAEGRLVTAVIRGVTGTYTYDAFGNRKTATGETNCYGQTVCATPLTLDSGTNRLLTTTNSSGTTTNVTYDAAGSITAFTGGSYGYDGTSMMTEATVGSDDRQFVYTADDERIAVRQGQSWTWTVRGLDNKVLREFTSVEPNYSAGLPAAGGTWVKDYIWRDGLLLASTDTTGTYHFHLDHLGTPRLITNVSGVKVAEHAYYPFGAEISLTPHESTEEAMKFTGHERDIVAGDGHTLDDMHARYYNASLGRFLRADPLLGDSQNPQSRNRYSYVENVPLGKIDPTGLAGALFTLEPVAMDNSFLFESTPDPDGGGSNSGQKKTETLPANPSGLGDRWTLDATHQNPNGEKFRDPDGNVLEWHHAQPGKPGWRGKDHWHYQPGGDKGTKEAKEHREPGTQIPGSNTKRQTQTWNLLRPSLTPLTSKILFYFLVYEMMQLDHLVNGNGHCVCGH